jgi:hypothetical protein
MATNYIAVSISSVSLLMLEQAQHVLMYTRRTLYCIRDTLWIPIPHVYCSEQHKMHACAYYLSDHCGLQLRSLHVA